MRGNQGDPIACAQAQSPTSLVHEDEAIGAGESETPIVVKKPGNAGGAKGCQGETTNRGDMPRN